MHALACWFSYVKTNQASMGYQLLVRKKTTKDHLNDHPNFDEAKNRGWRYSYKQVEKVDFQPSSIS